MVDGWLKDGHVEAAGAERWVILTAGGDRAEVVVWTVATGALAQPLRGRIRLARRKHASTRGRVGGG